MTPLRDLGDGFRAAFADRRVRALVALSGILIGGASTFYRWAEGWGWLDAVYFSVVTIATIGYGDLAPQTVSGKLFTICYVLCGLGLFVATATAIAERIVARAGQDEGDA